MALGSRQRGTDLLMAQAIYLLYFHPAVTFPGPKFAADTRALPMVPREAAAPIWGCRPGGTKRSRLFYSSGGHGNLRSLGQEPRAHIKTDLMDFGAGDLGFIWENDPAKRKAVAKKILPAFSSKAIRQKESVVQAYMDLFVDKMKELGSRPDGLLMNDWVLWLGVDMAADLAYSRELHHLRDGKTYDFVETILTTSFPGTLIQLAKKMPLIGLLAPLFVPLRVLRTIPAVLKTNAAEVHARIIDKRGKTKHPDFMDYMISPEDDPRSMTKKQLVHIEQVALQLFVAGFDPPQITFYAVLFFLVKYPETRAHLTREVRDNFKSYEDITPDALVQLPYMASFIHETLRVHATASNGMPRISPGAVLTVFMYPRGY
ncbi:cytochrome P450 [Apodospora peruviana]|uniref:Cytochrome P450 n=1 Tax=Apodospora peruviana TaxID=516989 RepID=A0AAE0I3M6_9PEZI|nr:cytochrome P450 [Apodospora peruviana]